MSNPAAELSNDSGNNPGGMSEEDILKRLEPKMPDDSAQ